MRIWFRTWWAQKRARDIGDTTPPDPGNYTPSLAFNDARNSQYIGLTL